jgi:hypothetical protein
MGEYINYFHSLLNQIDAFIVYSFSLCSYIGKYPLAIGQSLDVLADDEPVSFETCGSFIILM